METINYLIVQYQAIKLNKWLVQHKNKIEFQEYLKELRNIFNFIEPQNYKGIDRSALSGETEKELFKYSPEEDIYTKNARVKMYEILKQKQDAFLNYADFVDDENGFINIEDAKYIYNLIENKNEYEIIEVMRNNYTVTDKLLGFDIGYWGGDHFSIISDIIITPQWHPADPEDFKEIIYYANKLNQNILFKNENDALEYLKYYRTKKWAETDAPNENEESEFYIIQINKTN